MTRKRSSDQSVISVVDKDSEDMGDDSFLKVPPLETDNISNIIRSQAGIDVATLSGSTSFDKKKMMKKKVKSQYQRVFPLMTLLECI